MLDVNENWLELAGRDAEELSTRWAFRELWDVIAGHMKVDEHEEISRRIDLVADHADDLHPMILVAILRLTYIRKSEYYGSWRTARDKIFWILKGRNMDAQDILRGLFDDEPKGDPTERRKCPGSNGHFTATSKHEYTKTHLCWECNQVVSIYMYKYRGTEDSYALGEHYV